MNSVQKELSHLTQVLAIEPSRRHSIEVWKDIPMIHDHLALLGILFPTLKRNVREDVVIDQLVPILTGDRRFCERRQQMKLDLDLIVTRKSSLVSSGNPVINDTVCLIL